MAVPVHRRVLVHLHKTTEKRNFPVPFAQSLVDLLTNSSGEDEAQAAVCMKDDHILISSSPLRQDEKLVRLKRPSFCPIHNLNAEQNLALLPEIRERGVDVGAVTLVESADNQVLLIKRPENLRTFPGVWVPPGGHVECGEQLLDAGMRELAEETGLQLTSEMLKSNSGNVLGLWESAYPPMLSMGTPRRHHLVIYLHLALQAPYNADVLTKMLKPDPREVAVCAWLTRQHVAAIVAADEESDDSKIEFPHAPPLLKGLLVREGQELVETEVKTSVLCSRATGNEKDSERVSTGTKYALKMWLEAS